MELNDLQRDAIGMDELRDSFAETQDALMSVGQYSQPIQEAQMVCNHPQQIIDLLRQITDLQTKQLLSLQYDHSKME
jgi:hypothetical protein